MSQQSTSVSGSPILTESFSYYTGTGGTSGQLRQYTSAFTDGSLAYTYTYDDNGNIASVSDGTNTTSYVYDSQNQLVRENNQAAGKTWVWTYNDGGNIRRRFEYAYTTGELGTALDTVLYGYGDASWGELLTSYDGVSFTYDTIGNPLSDGTWTYTWEHGRQMASMSDGTTTWDMTYNADGLRTGRTNGSNTYTYWYNESGQLVRMKFNSLIFRIAYGASGQPISISYDGNTYYYVLNQQGDVMALLDSSGNWVVKYTYDAWGNILTTTASTTRMLNTLAKYNPLRYRGYVYDRETGLYYLQSRYYNPEIGRFISAASLMGVSENVLSHNLFAYYCNPSVNKAASTSSSKTDFSQNPATLNYPTPQLNPADIVIQYKVPLYDQNGYSLCWAFCQIMVEDYYAGIICTNEQATEKAIALSKSVNGDKWNRGGWPTNNADASGRPVFAKGIDSLFELFMALKNTGPMYGYYWGGPGTSAHLIVITGVDLTRGIVYTNNPWYYAGKQTYSEFLAGVASNRPTTGMPFYAYMIIN